MGKLSSCVTLYKCGEVEVPLARTHYRRCHLCGHLELKEKDLITQCSSCGKNFAPAYYFNERAALGLSQIETIKPPTTLPFNEYPSICGVSVYWDDS